MATTATGTVSGATTGLGDTTASMGAGTYAKIILTVKSAHNMRDKAWLGKSDPYCVIRLADAEIQTHHVKNAGEQCTWDESFSFNNVSPDDVIEFHVYDHNRLLKDAHMGEGSMSLRQVFEEGRLETRVPLTTRTGTKDAGEIWVSIRKEDGPAGAAEGMGLGTTMPETGVATTGVGSAGYGRTGYETTERSSGYERREDEYERASAGVGPTGVAGATAVPAMAYTERSGEVATGASAGDVSVTRQGAEEVCGREYFTKVEDRPVMKERVTRLREHQPVEKEFVVETRVTGVERETGQREEEHRGATEQVVEVTPPVEEQPTAEFFTKTEDRPVMKERVTRLREHHPVEKEFVVETRSTGEERETGQREEEHMGATDQVVEVTPPTVEQPTAEYFTKTEDRPAMKERVTRLREHRPVEKEFVVETRATGEVRETGERAQEHMGATERIVEVTPPRAPCE
ncbi:hypothetical protein ABPG77_008666 [Micractinium sp. CCAP 211/92]